MNIQAVFKLGLNCRSVLQSPGPSGKPVPQAELVAGESKGFERAGLVLQPRDSLFAVIQEQPQTTPPPPVVAKVN